MKIKNLISRGIKFDEVLPTTDEILNNLIIHSKTINTLNLRIINNMIEWEMKIDNERPYILYEGIGIEKKPTEGFKFQIKINTDDIGKSEISYRRYKEDEKYTIVKTRESTDVPIFIHKFLHIRNTSYEELKKIKEVMKE